MASLMCTPDWTAHLPRPALLLFCLRPGETAVAVTSFSVETGGEGREGVGEFGRKRE